MIASLNSLFTPLMADFEGYSIGKMLKYLSDPEIISFAGGLPSSDMFPKEMIKEVSYRLLSENSDQILQYTPIPGEKTLMEAIIHYLRRDNIQIQPENIMITTSGQHGLDLIGRLFLNPGDTIIADLPTFAGALVAFRMQKPEVHGVPLEPDGSNIGAIAELVTRLTAQGKKPKFIYVVPDFQNPAGITMSLAKRQQLLELSYKHNVLIIEDSPYRELRYRHDHIPALYALDSNGGNVIGVYTFSKMFVPGIRVGFNIGPAEVIEKFSYIKGANILCTPKLNQDICTYFLTQYDLGSHICRLKNFYLQKLDHFLKCLNDHFPPELNVTWTKPDGGLFLWIELPRHVDTKALFFEALQNKVAFVPGHVFYPESAEQYHAMRVNFSYPTLTQAEEGIKRLARAIKKKL